MVYTHPLFVWVNISNAKVVFLQQVEVVADEVKQVLSLCISLKEKIYMTCMLNLWT